MRRRRKRRNDPVSLKEHERALGSPKEAPETLRELQEARKLWSTPAATTTTTAIEEDRGE